MNLTRKLTHGSFYQTANTVCRGLFAFLLTPVIIAALGNRWYGFWVMVLAFLGSYELLDLGISVAVSRYVSRAMGAGNKQEINRIVNTSFAIFLVFGGVIALLTVASAAASPLFLDDPAEIRLFRRALLLLGLGMALNFPLKIFRGVLVAHLRYDVLNVVSVLRIVISSALIYGLLHAGHGLLSMALVTVCCGLAEGVAVAVFAKRVWPSLALGVAGLEWGVARKLFGYGGKAFVAQLADLLRFRVDTLVIAFVLNLNLVTVYDIGQKLSNLARELVGSMLNVMIPVFSQYEGRRDFESIREKFVILTRFGTVFACFAGGSLVIYGKALIQRWVGGGYVESYYILVILCVPTILEMTQNSSVQVLYGISKHHYYAAINVAEGVLNLVLSLVLANYYGIYGVALGTAIEMAIVKSTVLPWITCREIRLPLRDYYFKVLLDTSLKMAALLAAFGYCAQPFITPDYLRIALVGAIQVAVFVPLVYRLVLKKEERAIVRAALSRNR